MSTISGQTRIRSSGRQGALLGGVVGMVALAYAGAAGVMLLVGAIGMPWMEFAPDGAFRRRPQS